MRVHVEHCGTYDDLKLVLHYCQERLETYPIEHIAAKYKEIASKSIEGKRDLELEEAIARDLQATRDREREARLFTN